MYALPPEVAAPGRTLREVLQSRRDLGSYLGDAEKYRKTLLDSLASGKVVSTINTNTDGELFRVVNVPMAGGGWVATHEDVTEKLRAENMNEEQRRQLDAALENMSQGLCMFDGSQRLVVCNRKYAGLYGLSDEVIKPGTEFKAILAHRVACGAVPENQEEYVSNRLKIVTADKPSQSVHKLSNGRYISVAYRPLEGGGWVATHEDVTEAKRHEASFQLLFENNPVPMWVFDLDSLSYLAVNEAAIKHYGYSREEFLAMTVLDIRPAEERERFEKFSFEVGGTHDGEQTWLHQKADGTKIDVAIFSRALTYAGHDAGLVASIDVTDRIKAEDDLRRTKKIHRCGHRTYPAPDYRKRHKRVGSQHARQQVYFF